MIQASSYTLSAPVAGWNAKDPLPVMGELYARALVNWFPVQEGCVIRRGNAVHATGMGTGAVQTLAEFSGVNADRKLIACANGNIYDATTPGAATSLDSGFSNNYWQWVLFRDRLLMVNGQDTPQQYNGTAVSDATYTGSGLTPADLIHICVYRRRLYLTEKNSTSVWYGSASAITGALTEFDFGDVFDRGGYLLWCASHAASSSMGTDEVFVACSSLGEMLVYQGDNPGASDWSLIGRYYVPSLMGRRSVFRSGTGLVILTRYGAIPLNSLFSRQNDQPNYEEITDNIINAFRSATASYGTNTGWEGMVYPKGNWLIVNIPIATDTNSEQYVMNTQTGAWCRFTGMKACSWGLMNDDVYFGGTDGKVYKADTGTTDNGLAIRTHLATAFNYFRSRTLNKLVSETKPIITGSPNASFMLYVDVDFEDRTVTNTVTVNASSGDKWDVAKWDVAKWDTSSYTSKQWYHTPGLGKAVSVVMKADVQNIASTLTAFELLYTQGGVF